MSQDRDSSYDDEEWWKETPMWDHPRKCQCPKHRELIEKVEEVNSNPKADPVIRLCPDHYRLYFEDVLPEIKRRSKELSIPKQLLLRFIIWYGTKFNKLPVKQIPYMQSEQCFYCKFGSGGFGKKHTPYVEG